MRRIGLALSLIISFTTCNTADLETECSTPATVRDLTGLDGCGWVFELNDGTRLIPVVQFFCGTPPLPNEVTEDPLYEFEYTDGKMVFISYEQVNSMANVCMAGTMVRITCISEAPSNNSEE